MMRKKLNKIERNHTKHLNSNNKSFLSKASSGGLVVMASFKNVETTFFDAKLFCVLAAEYFRSRNLAKFKTNLLIRLWKKVF